MPLSNKTVDKNQTAPATQPEQSSAPAGGSRQQSINSDDVLNQASTGQETNPDLDPAKHEEAKDNKNTFNPKDHTGFHVMRGSEHLGTYDTQDDADAFNTGHLNGKGKVVQGKDNNTAGTGE